MAPGAAESLNLDDLPEPRPGPGDLLVETLMAGVCGTDHEILDGVLGYPPSGQDRQVLGHEALGRVATS